MTFEKKSIFVKLSFNNSLTIIARYYKILIILKEKLGGDLEKVNHSNYYYFYNNYPVCIIKKEDSGYEF